MDMEERGVDLLAGGPSAALVPALEKRLKIINQERALLIGHLENRAQHGEPEDLGGEQRLASSDELAGQLEKLRTETAALTERLAACKRLQP